MAVDTLATPESSNIQMMVYDDELMSLVVYFNSSGVYEYDGVPTETWYAIKNSSSKGKALKALVEKQFVGRRIE